MRHMMVDHDGVFDLSDISVILYQEIITELIRTRLNFNLNESSVQLRAVGVPDIQLPHIDVTFHFGKSLT